MEKIRTWTNGVIFEEEAQKQVGRTASLDVVNAVAVMPDVHYGKGSTVGTIIASTNAIIPATVSVDLSCGVVAMKTSLKANDLPDNLFNIRCEIEAAVPHGRSNNGGTGDRGAWGNAPSEVELEWKNLGTRLNTIVDKHPKIGTHNAMNHLGTLGGGNHMVELCLDEKDSVWIMVHSGSRGVGNRIGTYFINKAKEEMILKGIDLPDKDLAYLSDGTEIFNDYVDALWWATDFASASRKVMINNTFKVLQKIRPTVAIQTVVDCHHNYVSKEVHYKQDMWITRKGALRANRGEMAVILGSMGAKSFIVRGLGNAESFCSCSHGAGRVMSRGEAKKKISLDEHAKAMVGIEARLDADVLDESPSAYKNIDAVMAAQNDLVEIVHTLRQVVNIKG